MRTIFLAWVLLAPLAWAEPEISVQGLFANRAILVINGENRLLKAGQRSPEGVLLVSASSREAVIEVNGRRQTMAISQQIAGSFSAAQTSEVRIPRDEDSHYRVGGTINGHPVTMMVDTGATLVVMNINDAKRLGVNYRNGQASKASTAGGIVDSYNLNFERVAVGNIVVHNVPGAVVMGNFPAQILLGNSFLSRVSMEDQGGVLVLTSKY